VFEDESIFLNKIKKTDVIASASSLLQIYHSVHLVERPEQILFIRSHVTFDSSNHPLMSKEINWTQKLFNSTPEGT